MNLNEAMVILEQAGFICEADTSTLAKKLRNFIRKYRLTK